jgi:DNA-binding NtrC family response regulator
MLKVLVVDDDGDIRQLCARAMRRAGYEVVEAEDGLSAIKCLDDARGVHLLLTDVVMPGIDGLKLADMAKARWPELKVVYMSGFADSQFVRERAGTLHGPMLSKPWRIAKLQALVRDQIGAPDPETR